MSTRLIIRCQQTPSTAVFELTRALETITHWLLQHQAQHQDAHAFLQTYRPALDSVRHDLTDILPAAQRGLRQQRYDRFSADGFADPLAATIANFDHLPSALAVVHVSQLTGCSLPAAAAPFYDIGERLSLGWLRDGLQNLASSDTWEQLAARGLVMDNRHTQEALAIQAIRQSVDTDALFEPCRNVVNHYDAILADVQQSTLTLANASVLSRLLVQVARGTATTEQCLCRYAQQNVTFHLASLSSCYGWALSQIWQTATLTLWI